MAVSTDSIRLIAVAGIAGFIAGCWTGMGTTDGSEAYCVVTEASAPGRPGFAPGQFVEQDQDTGCAEGEPVVCGSYEGTGDDRTFRSDTCAD